MLGGLEPAYPMAICLIEPHRHEDAFEEVISQTQQEGFIYSEGGFLPTFIRYVIYKDGQYQVHVHYHSLYCCDSHTTTAVDLLVIHEGQVEELQVVGVFEDPEEDDLCVD
jgi:hypothetical protein